MISQLWVTSGCGLDIVGVYRGPGKSTLGAPKSPTHEGSKDR